MLIYNNINFLIVDTTTALANGTSVNGYYVHNWKALIYTGHTVLILMKHKVTLSLVMGENKRQLI